MKKIFLFWLLASVFCWADMNDDTQFDIDTNSFYPTAQYVTRDTSRGQNMSIPDFSHMNDQDFDI